MLNKLANIANSLDAAGMHDDADVVTNVLARVANFFDREERGPIKDFKPGSWNEIENPFGSHLFVFYNAKRCAFTGKGGTIC